MSQKCDLPQCSARPALSPPPTLILTPWPAITTKSATACSRGICNNSETVAPPPLLLTGCCQSLPRLWLSSPLRLPVSLPPFSHASFFLSTSRTPRGPPRRCHLCPIP